MKLQKLVYYAHGWYLSYSGGQPLINERVAAWTYGPVINDLYHEFKEYGNNPIARETTSFSWHDDGGKGLVFETVTPTVSGDPLASSILAMVWNSYKQFSAAALSQDTHTKGSPWDQIWNDQNGKNQKNAIIPDGLIKAHFDRQRTATIAAAVT